MPWNPIHVPEWTYWESGFCRMPKTKIVLRHIWQKSHRTKIKVMYHFRHCSIMADKQATPIHIPTHLHNISLSHLHRAPEFPNYAGIWDFPPSRRVRRWCWRTHRWTVQTASQRCSSPRRDRVHNQSEWEIEGMFADSQQPLPSTVAKKSARLLRDWARIARDTRSTRDGWRRTTATGKKVKYLPEIVVE